MPDGNTAAAPLSPGGCLRVLVVDADGGVTSQLAAALEGSSEAGRFTLERASSLRETLEGLAANQTDVLLLPVSPGQGLGPLVTIRAEAPTLPIVVLCGAGDEPLAVKAVQLGATDYLIAERLYGTLAARSLRHAVEVARVRVVLARYQAEWPPPSGEASSRPAPLRAAFPERFAELARDYGEILDRAVEQILQRRPMTLLEERLQRLASLAAELRAGPRDIVELHASAMRQREAEHGPQRMKLYLAEGRVRLLELMGHLVTFYRDRWPGGPRPGAD